MHGLEREVAVRQPYGAGMPGEELFQGGRGLLADRAFEIAELDDHDGRIRGAGHMVRVTDSSRQFERSGPVDCHMSVHRGWSGYY
jgi:hypothetical protein